jgi:hypothetical protein
MVSAYESHHGTLDSMEMRNLCPHKDVTTNPLGFEVYKPEKDTYNSIQKESTLGKCHCPFFFVFVFVKSYSQNCNYFSKARDYM